MVWFVFTKPIIRENPTSCLPKKGWLWTTRKTYPYFFDSTTETWMYFQSGNEKPRFYHFGTKEWMTVE